MSDIYVKAVVDALEGIKLALEDQTELFKKNLELLNRLVEERREKNPMSELLAITAKLKALKESKKDMDKTLEGSSGG